MTSVMVLLAQGVEEIEATIIIDVLRRAQWEVQSVGLDDDVVVGSRGVKLVTSQGPGTCFAFALALV